MPFALEPAVLRLRQSHGDALAFRRTLLDVAFAAGCPVSEQAVALEHGDAVTLRMASRVSGEPRLRLAILDLEPPGRSAAWPTYLDALGGPALAQTWAVALHTLLREAPDEPWELRYTRGPALGVPAYVTEQVATGSAIIQLATCASLPGRSGPLDAISVRLRRAENVWRLPACDWTAEVIAHSPDALAHLRDWLRSLTGDWTLHQLTQNGPALTAVLRAGQPLVAPPGVTLRELQTPPRLTFPVNDALLAWPQAWLAQPLAVRTHADGLWLAGVTTPLADDAPLPERVGALVLDWQVEPVARAFQTQSLLAVSAGEAAGPVAAGFFGDIWRLPRGDELGVAARALKAKLQTALKV